MRMKRNRFPLFVVVVLDAIDSGGVARGEFEGRRRFVGGQRE